MFRLIFLRQFCLDFWGRHPDSQTPLTRWFKIVEKSEFENFAKLSVAIPDVSGVEVLKYFMEEHSLTQSDFPEIGSQGVVSELLSGKRELNLRQIQALSQRFHVSPAVFI